MLRGTLILRAAARTLCECKSLADMDIRTDEERPSIGFFLKTTGRSGAAGVFQTSDQANLVEDPVPWPCGQECSHAVQHLLSPTHPPCQRIRREQCRE